MSKAQFWPATPWVIGHRGAPRQATENTLAAFEAAITAGADMVEFDVRQSSDGVLFIYHGSTLRVGSALRRVPIRTLTYAQICANVGATAKTRRRLRIHGGEPPPKFEDVVKKLAGRVRLDVEIKVGGYEAEVFRVLKRHMKPGSYVVTSFRESVVATCKTLAPDVRVGLLLGSRGRGQSLGLFPFRRAQRCGADFIVPEHVLANAALLARASKRGIPVVLYTVNNRRRLESLLKDPRVAGVVTDVPDLAVGIRDGGKGMGS